MIDLLKTYFHLGSPIAIIVALAVCAVWIFWRPESRNARRLLAVIVVGYWLAATPIGARGLAGIVGYGYSGLPDAASAGGANTIVIMGGGELPYRVGGAVLPVLSPESALRTLEGARVYRLLGRATIVASGGRLSADPQLPTEAEVLRRALIEVGVPADDIVSETESRTTRDQALLVGEMLRRRGVVRFLLVTSKTHMRRSMAAFRSLGFDPVPSASPIRSDMLPPPRVWLPSGEWLTLSDMAVYDAAAIVYYWLKGWV